MKRDVLFTLPAEALEGASQIMLLGDFNNWTPSPQYELERRADGSASTTVSLEAGKTYQYRFLIDGERWENDYRAQRYEPAAGYSVENSVITVDVGDHVNADAQSAESDTAKKQKTKKEKAEAKPARAKTAKTAKGTEGKAEPVKAKAEKQAAPKAEKQAASTSPKTDAAKATEAKAPKTAGAKAAKPAKKSAAKKASGKKEE